MARHLILLMLSWAIAGSTLQSSQYSAVFHPYADGCNAALISKTPLVVFVGHIPNIEVKGVVHATVPALEGYPAKCIVVSVPEKGDLYWKATLSANATEKQVLAALITKEVAVVTARPFQQQHCPT